MSTPTVKKTRASKGVTDGEKKLSGDQGSVRPTSQLWPEWSDQDINAEKWGAPRPGPEKEKKGKSKTHSAKSAKSAKTITSKSTAGTTIHAEPELFEDPYLFSLPWSLKKQFTWIRPQIMHPEVRLVVFSSSSPLIPDLVAHNRELFISPLIRSVVSAVHMLCYISQTRRFNIEWQSPQYQASTEGQVWKPWHHIYSLCRAGKGQSHNPVANTLGKYVVRLYWLGCWRKFIVDDRYPVDTTGRLLLPVSNISTGDKEFELWPALLTKALLKIASLTWSDKNEIVDFDVVTCLTGWSVQKIFTKGMDTQDIWEVCCGYSDHYTWDQRLILGPFEEEPVPLAVSASTSKKSKSTKSAKSTKSSKSGKKSATGNVPPRSFHLTLSCSDLSTLEENAIENITPCYEHDFLIEETRNIPLINTVPEYDRNIAKWKEFRWVDWAVSHDLWDRVYDWEIYKFMRMVSSMRKVDENVIYEKETTDLEKFIKHSVKTIDEFVERKKEEKNAVAKVGKKKKEKKKEKKEKKEKDKASKHEKASSKGSKKLKTAKVFVDPSIWSDFAKLAPYITCISVYLKPSSFHTNYVISDVQFSGASDPKAKKPSKKEDKKGKGPVAGDDSAQKYVYWENVLMRSRNEAIYLFTDSVDFKLTMFSLAHMGNELPTLESEKVQEKSREECRKLFCEKKKCPKECICQKEPSEAELVEEIFVDTRKYAYLIVEDYDWKTLRIGDMPIVLKTCGNKSVLIDLEKGRHVKRIWVEGNTPCVLQIFSDTDTRVGKIDEILECMQEESELVMQSCFSICTGFGLLIRFFGFPEYLEALKQFYKSYMPSINLSKKQMTLIHDAFLEELIKVLAVIFPQENHYEISRAMRILLLNPNFRIPYKVQKKQVELTETPDCTECPCEDIDRMKLREISAIKIQSYFKMIYVKKLKSLQNPYNKKFQPVVELLKQIYQGVFSSKVRSINIDLLRSLAHNKSLKNVNQYFPFYKDLNSVIVLKQFSGDLLDIKQYSWVPLIRRQFFCNTSDLICIRAYIFCSLPEYVLRIFNNDTGKEFDRYTNNALVCKYGKNEKGYTILGYGWTDEHSIKILNWKLYVVIEKILNTCPVDCDNLRNVANITRGNYIPNKDNLIIKFSLKIQESCIGTFHFEVSSPTAKIKIQCLNKYGDVIFEAIGTSAVIIPAVSLVQIIEESQASQNNSKINLNQISISGLTRSKSEIKTNSRIKLMRSRSFIKKRSPSRSERKSHGSTSSKKKHLRVSVVYEHDPQTEYIIQAFVLEDSWPLTPKEWELVENLRTRGSIENELNLSSPSLYKQDSRKSMTTSKKIRIMSSKKLLKGNSSFFKTENEKPFWILTNFIDVKNFCTVTIDNTRLEEIKNVKRNIFQTDPSRYWQGQELRKEYLEKNYIKWSPKISVENLEVKDFSSQYNMLSEDLSKSLTMQDSSKISVKSKTLISQLNTSGDKIVCPECNKPQQSEELYLKAPESIHKMLVPFEINKYDKKLDKFRWLVLPEQEEKIFNQVTENISTFEREYNEYFNEMNEYLEKNKFRHEFLWKWFENIRQDSLQIMKENQTKRENLISKMKAAALANEEPNKKGKGKRKKK